MKIDYSWILFGLCLLGIIGINLFVVLFIYVSQSMRSKALMEKAATLGFHYEKYNLFQHIFPAGKKGEGVEEVFAELDGFLLLALGQRSRHVIYNLISGTYEGVNIKLFDHRYIGAGGARSSRSISEKMTVLRLDLRHVKLPRFCLRPGSKPIFYNNIPGFQDLPLESNFPLASQYWLQGDDPERIRLILSDPVLDWLAQANWLSVEGGGRYLVIYWRRLHVAADKLENFLQQGIQLLRLIEAQPGIS